MAALRLKICLQTCSVCRLTVTLLHRSVELDIHWTRCRSTLLAEALGECVLPFIHTEYKLRSADLHSILL